MKKKIIFTTLALLIASWLVWAKTYTFNVSKATEHLTRHALKTSHTCCAWYTMRALQAGGCPAMILPAHSYSWFMPVVGFKEISSVGYCPQPGDVVVFEQHEGHIWSHIAMYNGTQWISDFKQKHMNPYGTPVPYRLFRCKRKR